MPNKPVSPSYTQGAAGKGDLMDVKWVWYKLLSVLGLRRSFADWYDKWVKEGELVVCDCGRIARRKEVNICGAGHVTCERPDCDCPCPVIVENEEEAAFIREEMPDAAIIIAPV